MLEVGVERNDFTKKNIQTRCWRMTFQQEGTACAKTQVGRSRWSWGTEHRDLGAGMKEEARLAGLCAPGKNIWAPSPSREWLQGLGKQQGCSARLGLSRWAAPWTQRVPSAAGGAGSSQESVEFRKPLPTRDQEGLPKMQAQPGSCLSPQGPAGVWPLQNSLVFSGVACLSPASAPRFLRQPSPALIIFSS